MRKSLLFSTLSILMVSLLAMALPASAQQAPNAYKGLVPGEATRADVESVLGPPPASLGSGGDPRYPVEGKPGLSDRLFFSREKLEAVRRGHPPEYQIIPEMIIRTHSADNLRDKRIVIIEHARRVSGMFHSLRDIL